MPERIVELHPEAESEYLRACEQYDEIDVQLADRFEREFCKTVAQIAAGILTYPKLNARSVNHIALVRGFPYSVIHSETEPGTVTIFAVAHFSRDSAYWKDRRRF